MNALFVFLGGGTGSVLRYLVGLWIGSGAFPWATFAVNAVGSFAIGLQKWLKKDERKVGVCADMRRSVMVMNLRSLLYEGAITKDDLDGFSDELRQSLILSER